MWKFSNFLNSEVQQMKRAKQPKVLWSWSNLGFKLYYWFWFYKSFPPISYSVSHPANPHPPMEQNGPFNFGWLLLQYDKVFNFQNLFFSAEPTSKVT